MRELALLGNSEHMQTAGRLANEHPPVLRTHDRYGNRVDEVEYLPQYHDLMQHGRRARAARRPVGRHRDRARTSPARRR